jgi:hypothetical protein
MNITEKFNIRSQFNGKSNDLLHTLPLLPPVSLPRYTCHRVLRRGLFECQE